MQVKQVDEQVVQRDFDRAVAFLKSRSADTLPHTGGTLLPHLLGTHALLREWGNPPEVCLAGLCHTAYGTDGFPAAFIDPADPSRRADLVQLIGPAAERLVYFYASCDRAFLYPKIIQGVSPVVYRDRFTGAVSEPDPGLYRAFLELTFANELEIFRRCEMTARQREKWKAILSACRGQVSKGAFALFLDTLSPPWWQFWKRRPAQRAA